jgi:predicted acetyltransferase
MTVELQRVTTTERATLANLYELYLYDFSSIEGGQIGDNGRYSSPDALDPYWDDPERHAFLIRSDGQLAGFGLAKRGSALAGDLKAMDLAEFFILRATRRGGIGRQAAALIWRYWPGPWVVRVLIHNPEAVGFWEAVIADHTQGNYRRDSVSQTEYSPPRQWVIFRFVQQ